MIPADHRNGFSLLEVIAALVIAATVAAISIRYLRVPGQTGKQRSCDVTREILQNYATTYSETNGQFPSRDLRELGTTQYAGIALPTCPVTKEAYTIGRSGSIACPTHEATR